MVVNLDLRSMLSHPRVYRAFTYAIGSEEGRKRYAREIVRARPGDRVLDIGCGPADVLQYLPAVEYHGFDLNPASIEDARRRFGDRGSFYCHRVSRDAVEDLGQFELVMATGMLHHLSDDQGAALFEIAHKALAAGGRFVSCDGWWVPRQNPITRMILALDRGAYVPDVASYVRLARQVFSDVQTLVTSKLSRLPYTYIVLQCVR